ncbi:phosphopantetheine-binding protein [Nocardiopsis algeriensis]|uniref:phosphopantetheine-binding protein n=1 Tax=Nocardiopsis algeriensis TaxID=1478215 RepID=UPI003B42D701
MAPALTAERLRDDVAAVLGEPPESIDPDENLMDRGLDSVRLMSLMETWRTAGADPDFTDLAQTPTVSAWAALLSR